MTARRRPRRRRQLTRDAMPATLAAIDAAREHAGRRFLAHVGDYLAAIGWRALVAGPIGIEARDSGDLRYRLLVDFTDGAPGPLTTSQDVVTPRRRSKASR